ncbi:DUF5702 domain-containing protein [Sporosalibacterium faouarense]|uniref:DUF5702 domain-containing protein n=1 Tax=Sporosalibacterium faouarense TaxID=516123 RepID=UPI00192B47F6|nr:DUF5702 domain-containing protein [Sporosalibacterium faouarense]
MKKSGERGAITVFLSIILLVIIILAGSMVDAARIITAKSQAERAANSSVNSILANYRSDLKEQYGLFAFKGNNLEEINSIIDYFMKRNLRPQDGLEEYDINENFVDIYDFSIDSDSQSFFDLEQNQVLKDEILEIMKYRAPKELIETFLEKLEIIKKSSKTANLIEKKIEVEDSFRELGEEQEELSKKLEKVNSFSNFFIDNCISKITKKTEEYNKINKEITFKKEEIRETEIYLDDIKKERKEIKEKIEDIVSELNEIELKIGKLEDNEENKKEIQSLKKDLNNLKNNKDKLVQDEDKLRDKIDKDSLKLKGYKKELNEFFNARKEIFNDIKSVNNDLNNYIEEYKIYNQSAKGSIIRLMKKSLDAQSILNIFEGTVNSEEYINKIIIEVERQIKKDLSDYKNRLKGTVGNSISNNYGSDRFKYSNISEDMKKNVENYIEKLREIVEGISYIQDTSQLQEVIDLIAFPVATNFEILDYAGKNADKFSEEISRIDKILGNNNKLDSDKRIKEIVTDEFLLTMESINMYSNDIKYIEFEEKNIPKNIKNYKKAMEKRDISELSTEENIAPKFKNKEFLSNYNNSNDSEKKRFENLPSSKKDNPDTFDNIYYSLFNESDEKGADTNGNKSSDIQWNESKETDKKQIKNSLGLITKLGEVIKEGTVDFRDSLYIDEYIMGTFRSTVDKKAQLEGNTVNSSDYFSKYERYAYFDDRRGNSEIEYILSGKSSYVSNVRSTQVKIYMIRVAMNLIHVYSNPDKMQIATEIATLASGAIPLLTPIITTIIIFGWSSLESLIDMNYLMDGKSVPFFKIYEEEWRLGYGSIAPFAKKVLIDKGSKLAEDMVLSFVDQMVDMIFTYINEAINKILISVDKNSDELFLDFESDIRDKMDILLKKIPDTDVRKEIEDTIDIDSLVYNVKEILKEKSNEGKKNVNNQIGKFEKETSESIKKVISNSLNPLKKELKERLESKIDNSPLVKNYIKKEGKATLKKMSKNSYNLRFNYYDYLRLLLLIEPENTKLRRIMDLIELNQQEKEKSFKLSDYYTYLKADIIASIKYMFINRNFLKDNFNFKDNKHYSFKFSILKGY